MENAAGTDASPTSYGFVAPAVVNGLPFKPGDWAVDPCGERVARVIRVYSDGEDDALLDLSIYSHKGDRVGRSSPACGGPKSFEPACQARFWERIARPSFPIIPKWVDNGDGTRTARLWAGERLPPANWTPPPPKARPAPSRAVSGFPETLNRAEYQHLVDLFTGANDPVSASIATKSVAMIAWLDRHVTKA